MTTAHVRNTAEFQESLAAHIRDFVRKWRGEPVTQRVVRVDTPGGPLYLRSVTGSSTEWISEQRYARKYDDRLAAKCAAAVAFCPDAVRAPNVVRLVPRGAGYHIRFQVTSDVGVFITKDAAVAEPYGAYRDRIVFRSKDEAHQWINARQTFLGYDSFRSKCTIVPETPELPVAGASQ